MCRTIALPRLLYLSKYNYLNLNLSLCSIPQELLSNSPGSVCEDFLENHFNH